MPTDAVLDGNDTPSPFALIAIDLDGTLVDTVGDLHAAVVRMQDAMGREHASIEAVRDWVGNGIERLVHRALTGSMQEDAAPALFEEAMPRFMAAYDETNGTASPLYPGVVPGLEWLVTLDVPLVCVTNKAGRFSRPLLDALGLTARFTDHIAGDDVPAKKPDPAALLEAARRAGAEPSRCLLIGDSVSDIRAARAAGFAVVAVSYGYNHGRPIGELDGELRPDAVIDSFAELPEVFARLAAERRAQ